MIEYINRSNPDDRILAKAANHLNSNGLIVFPTDTNWILACNPFSKAAVEKVYKFKGEHKSKHFSILCDTISRAAEVAYISDSTFRMINKKIPGPYTFIFEAKKLMTKALKASKTDHEIGIRFVPDLLVEKVIQTFDGVLLSTQLPLELFPVESADEIYGLLIDTTLGEPFALILDPGDVYFGGASTIVNFCREDTPEVLREGQGQWP